jgi:hypothetical protein
LAELEAQETERLERMFDYHMGRGKLTPEAVEEIRATQPICLVGAATTSPVAYIYCATIGRIMVDLDLAIFLIYAFVRPFRGAPWVVWYDAAGGLRTVPLATFAHFGPRCGVDASTVEPNLHVLNRLGAHERQPLDYRRAAIQYTGGLIDDHWPRVFTRKVTATPNVFQVARPERPFCVFADLLNYSTGMASQGARSTGAKTPTFIVRRHFWTYEAATYFANQLVNAVMGVPPEHDAVAGVIEEMRILGAHRMALEVDFGTWQATKLADVC